MCQRLDNSLELCSATMRFHQGYCVLVLQCCQDRGEHNNMSILQWNIFLTNTGTVQCICHCAIQPFSHFCCHLWLEKKQYIHLEGISLLPRQASLGVVVCWLCRTLCGLLHKQFEDQASFPPLANHTMKQSYQTIQVTPLKRQNLALWRTGIYPTWWICPTSSLGSLQPAPGWEHRDMVWNPLGIRVTYSGKLQDWMSLKGCVNSRGTFPCLVGEKSRHTTGKSRGDALPLRKGLSALAMENQQAEVWLCQPLHFHLLLLFPSGLSALLSKIHLPL